MGDRIRWLVLTAGGLGALKPAPGTWGSLPPVVLILVLQSIGGQAWLPETGVLLLGLAGAIGCVRFGDWAEGHWGRKDPGAVVADEVAGQAIPLLMLPWRRPDEPGAWGWNITLALLSFAAFRGFDISKPPPARGLQRLRSGWGILVDDLIAGVYAAIVVQLLSRLVLPGLF